MSVAAPWAMATRLSGGESRILSARYWSDRARVRCFDSSSTAPSTRATTGLMESIEPEQRPGPADPAALLEVLEVVDDPVDGGVRETSSLARASRASRSAPAAASSAASSTMSPRPIVTDRLSTTRTSMRSATALAAATAA